MEVNENGFRIGTIGAETEGFSALLLPRVRTMMENGEDLIALGLIHNEDTAAGALAGALEDTGVFRLYSLYVTPEYRRMGGATMLMDALADLLTKEGPSVLLCSYTDNGEESRALHEFLADRGAEENEEEESQYLISLKELYSAKGFALLRGESLFTQLNKLSREELLKVVEMAEGDGVRIFKNKGKIHAGLSLAGIKDGKIFGALLVEEVNPEELLLIRSAHLEEGFELKAGEMMQLFTTLCFKHYSRDAGVLFPASAISAFVSLREFADYLPGAVEIQHEAVLPM